MRNTGRSRVIHAGVQTVTAGIASQLFLLVSGPLLARLLGVDGRGHLAGLVAWPSFIVPLGTLGLATAITYDVSRSPTRASRALGALIQIGAIQSIVLSGVLGLVLWSWTQGRPSNVRVAAYPIVAIVPSLLCFQYATATIQGLRRFTRFNLTRVLPPAIYALGAVVLYWRGEDRLVAVTSLWVMSYGVAAVISSIALLSVVRPRWSSTGPLRKALLYFGLRSHLGALSPVDSLRIDQLLGAILLSTNGLGLYSVAYALCNLPRVVADGVGKVLYPLIAERTDTSRRRTLFWSGFGLVSAANMALGFVLILLMPLLIPLLFGSEFAAATPVAQVLLVGTTLVASKKVLSDGLRGLGRPGASTLPEVVIYPWLVLAAPLIVRRYGLMGLAASLTVAYAISFVVALGLSLRVVRMVSSERASEEVTL